MHTPPHAQPHIKVLIADDHSVVREGVRALVDAQPGIEVIGIAADGVEAWRQARELSPDVLVLDLSLPDMSGVEATERITRDCPSVRVLALTMHEERGYVSRMLQAGAAGYAVKRSAASELVRAIRTVAAGDRYVDPSIVGSLLDEYVPHAGSGGRTRRHRGESLLTPREDEVLRLLALGHSNKEIATSLVLSVKTVETHRASGMTKLGLANRAALVRYAITEGWLQDS